jgi:hypothetical protein
MTETDSIWNCELVLQIDAVGRPRGFYDAVLFFHPDLYSEFHVCWGVLIVTPQHFSSILYWMILVAVAVAQTLC